MNVKAIYILILTGLIPLHADQYQLERMFHSVLNSSQGKGLPKELEFHDNLVSTIPTLNPEHLPSLSAQASKCLKSPDIEVQKFGVFYFMQVAMRMDSAVLLEPRIDDLAEYTNNPANKDLHNAALFSIVYLNPRIPEKGISVLVPMLISKLVPDEERAFIGAALLTATPSDADMLHKVLTALKGSREPKAIINLIRSLGILKTRHAEALALIGESLEHKDAAIRMEAVDAVERLDRDLRVKFEAKIIQISIDESESAENRSRAKAALK